MSVHSKKVRARNRRRIRRLTESTARVWGVLPCPGEFTRPLSKRLLCVMAGNAPPDVRACFWYNPSKGGAFEPIEDPNREAFLFRLSGDDLIGAGLTAVFCQRPMIADVTYYGKRWAYQTRAGFRVNVWLYLPKDSPDREYHQADVRRLGTGIVWCNRTGLRPVDDRIPGVPGPY